MKNINRFPIIDSAAFEKYTKLINDAKSTVSIDATEVHHIIPRSMGGNNDPQNLVKLTREQHYEAHYLLWQAYKNQQMSCAFHLMTTNRSDRRPLTAAEFALLRDNYRTAKIKYWETITDSERAEHCKKSNPWANKSEAEIALYKQKCNPWANKSEAEIADRKKRMSAKLTGRKSDTVGVVKDKNAKVAAYKMTVAKRTPEQRAALNFGNNANTIWINNGIQNKRVKKDIPLQNGWTIGKLKMKHDKL